MRRRISAAAASVKVTINSSSSETALDSAQSSATQRATSVLVLPAPAPASSNTLPRAARAADWDGVGDFMRWPIQRNCRVGKGDCEQWRPAPAAAIHRR